MITHDVYTREQLADAIEAIAEEVTFITLHRKRGKTVYRFYPEQGLRYYHRLRPEDIGNRAIKQARRFSAVHAYLQHLKNLAATIRKTPKRTFE